jgi:hypothetical protein
MAQLRDEAPLPGVCPKCGLKMASLKKLMGERHKAGASPDIAVHKENFMTRCPGETKTPLLCEFYYTSIEEYERDRKSKMGQRRAAERARLEREKRKASRA